MTDFLTLYHDEIRWAFFMAGIVLIGFLTNWGTFKKHKSIRWKVRLIALPVLFVALLLYWWKSFWTIEDVLFTFAFAVLFWFALFFRQGIYGICLCQMITTTKRNRLQYE